MTLWAVLALGGTLAMSAYSNTDGPAAHTPEGWISSSTLELSADRPTLLFFLHPKCPCSRASVAELSRLVMRAGEAMALTAVIYHPENSSPEWEGDLGRRMREISGAEIHVDRGGVEAERFGVTTSGHALLFDREGTRLYSGGITAGRGHEGENRGRRAIEEWLHQSSPASATGAPTFGCTIRVPDDTSAETEGVE